MAVGQNHAADMLGQMARKPEDLADEMNQLTTEPAARLEASLCQASAKLVAGIGMTDELGQRVDAVER